MSTTTLKPIRQRTKVTLPTTLTDHDVRMSWPDFDSIKAFIYSEAQRIISGPCEWTIDPEDDTILKCTYGADRAQHLGIQRLVVVVELDGQKNTYDHRAFRFVATTDETLADGTTVQEETAEVDINVEDVDSSILTGAIAAALAAAEAANEAAAHVPYIGENGNWFQWDATQESYVDTGVSATGPQGNPGQDGQDGADGGLLYPTFHIDAAMHLQMDTEQESNRFALNGAGHLTVNI